MSNRIALATAHDAREDFINEAGGASKDDFIAYGKDVVQPGRECYKKTYLAEGGDLHVFRKAMEGASVLNPLTLKTLSLEQARNLVPLLKYFGFKHFTEQFLGKLKTQMSSLIEAANQQCDWDSVEGAAEYNISLEKENRSRANLNGREESLQPSREVKYRTWEDDPAERARRIWFWWRDHNPQFEDFATAVRLVGLVQVLSASVERLFSQLKLVVNAVGHSQLEETLEARLFVQENMLPNGCGLPRS